MVVKLRIFKQIMTLEFQGIFQEAAEKLGLSHYFNPPKKPQENPVNERFNPTLKEEKNS